MWECFFEGLGQFTESKSDFIRSLIRPQLIKKTPGEEGARAAPTLDLPSSALLLGGGSFQPRPPSICTLRAAWGFPGDSDGEEPACNAGDLALIPGSERSFGEGNGYPL